MSKAYHHSETLTALEHLLALENNSLGAKVGSAPVMSRKNWDVLRKRVEWLEARYTELKKKE